MTRVMRSMRRRSSATLTGGLVKPLRPVWKRLCAGISTTRPGGNAYWTAVIASNESAQWTAPNESQRHHPRRRFRHATAPTDARRVQTTLAGLRQAADLLPAVYVDARGHSRRAHHLD